MAPFSVSRRSVEATLLVSFAILAVGFAGFFEGIMSNNETLETNGTTVDTGRLAESAAASE